MGLEKYSIEGEIFSAGPSTFFRATDRMLGSSLALQRLTIDASRAADVRDTFFREKRHTAQIVHPRVRRPIDIFEDDGYLWAVTEFTQGQRSSWFVHERGFFPLAEAAHLGAQVADALSTLHVKGFIHGKVTPDVVLIDERGDAELINFVKSADLAAGIWPLRPAVLGLSPFTAPEEFGGARPTPASDLYGLAATVVYWLTGHWARGGDGPEDALARAARGSSLTDIPLHGRGLPAALQDALLDALAADPAERRGSVDSLGSLLIEVHQRQAAEVPSGFAPGETLTPDRSDSLISLMGRHGAGAFGVVLRAEMDTCDRPLAVKALKPEHRDDQEARERFLREARALQRIEHRNVVRIMGVGEKLGTPYAVMEFIDGPDLATLLLREGTLSPDRTLHFARGITEGLVAIHRENVIHRDLKPHNILVADGERPVIADFGVARRAGGTRMTHTGHLIGTPAYMAPEQFTEAAVTHAVDLFALGSILYEMVSGRPPFPATDMLSLIRSVQQDEPEPLPGEVPPALQHVILRLLEKDPTKRTPSAEALRVELAAIPVPS
jgi:serine/threonine protein kinase